MDQRSPPMQVGGDVQYFEKTKYFIPVNPLRQQIRLCVICRVGYGFCLQKQNFCSNSVWTKYFYCRKPWENHNQSPSLFSHAFRNEKFLRKSECSCSFLFLRQSPGQLRPLMHVQNFAAEIASQTHSFSNQISPKNLLQRIFCPKLPLLRSMSGWFWAIRNLIPSVPHPSATLQRIWSCALAPRSRSGMCTRVELCVA